MAKKAKKPAVAAMTAPPKPKNVLVLRTCRADMTSHNGFRWPAKGHVECNDWDPKPECGNGLHGLKWAQGNWSLLSKDVDAKWLVVEVDESSLVDIDGKVKFPRGNVIYCGDQALATTLIACSKEAFEDTVAKAKKKSIASGAYSSAASSGAYSSAASSGDSSRAASSGDSSRAASSGAYSSAASSGDYSSAAQTGQSGVACTIGRGGAVKAGLDGLLIATWWDETAKRFRACVGEVGIDGIKADTWYIVRNGKMVER